MMLPNKTGRLSIAALFLSLGLALLLTLAPTALPVSAQEGEEEAAPAGPGRLVISRQDASSLPEIELLAYATDGLGQPLNLATQPLAVTHGGQPAASVEVIGTHPAGTFTLFVVDVPPGVSEQIPAIQAAIEQFASPATMVEQVDQLSVYRVGNAGPEQLLAPTGFHNAVRNFFTTPLDTQVGLTALYDSVVALLDDVDNLKPRSDMAASVVLITDGTDAISSLFSGEDVYTRAGALKIPIHTIWLDNANLSELGEETGQRYLADVAAQSGGIATRMDEPDTFPPIWERIGAFREHAIVHYAVAELAGGTFPVNLSLANDAAVSAATTVEIAPGAPIVQLEIPPGSRSLTLPSLDEPIRLGFDTTLAWLDGVEREALRAQLLVNGVVIHEIDVANLDAFNAEVPNFNYGINSLRIAVVDDAGGQATTPVVLLTVGEGDTFIPEALQPGGFTLPGLDLGGSFQTFLYCCIGLLLLLLLFGIIAWWFRIRVPGLDGLLRRLPGRKRGGTLTYQSALGDVTSFPTATVTNDPPSGPPFLEIVHAATPLPRRLDLNGVEVRLGRSPQQADIVFEDDPTVSRLHASIVRDGYEFRLYDEQSTSGTLVNGIAVPPHGVALINGDEVHLGAVHLRFKHG